MRAPIRSSEVASGAPAASGIVLDVRYPHSHVEIPIEDWLRTGPGISGSTRPVAARLAPSGYPLPIRCIVPLRYRNTRLSRLLIALRLLPDPWRIRPSQPIVNLTGSEVSSG